MSTSTTHPQVRRLYTSVENIKANHCSVSITILTVMQLKISTLAITSVLFVTQASASSDPYGNVFIPAKSTDSRSPCPGLNT